MARLAGLSAGGELLAPAYNCGSEIDPFIQVGLHVRLFRVDGSGRIDIDDFRSQLSARTRVVLVIHYFGWPQPLNEIADLCRSRQVLLIEDCALALFSAHSHAPVGCIGDAAVFSLPKTLFVPDGGVLSLRSDQASEAGPLTSPSVRRVLRRTLPLLKARALSVVENLRMFALARPWLNSRSASESGNRDDCHRPDMPANYYSDPRVVDRTMSRVTAGLLASVRPADVVERRRQNYTRISALMGELRGVRPLFPSLPQGVCPLSLPIVVSDRRAWLRELKSRGIPAIGWWAGFHRRLSWDAVEEACFLKNSVLALPVHQDLTDQAVEYIGTVMRELGNRLASNH